MQNGVMTDADGTPFTFEILVSQNATESRRSSTSTSPPSAGSASRPTITAVDSAQYTERTQAFDFDMAPYVRGLSLSPGNEQKLYWGAEMADEEGSRNWMGVKSPAIDAMIDTMLDRDLAGGVPRRHQGARPAADRGALRDPDLVFQREPCRPCEGAALPRPRADVRRLARVPARRLVVGGVEAR